MRFVAFSDAHVASKVGQRMLQYKTDDYKNIRSLLNQLLQKPPDAVVNLGDWWEPLYDRSTPTGDIFDLYAELCKAMPVFKLAGNHDRKDGLPYVFLRGVRFEHGHACGVSKNVEAIRSYYRGQRVVHGHTHEPQEGWPLDVGSITFTGTYGEIIDGVPYLREV